MKKRLLIFLFLILTMCLIVIFVGCSQSNSIVSIEKTGSSGNIDTYTITYSDGSISYFTVTNGIDGEQGIQGIPGEDGHTPVITIGENGNWFIDGVDSNQTAIGKNGNSIVSIEKTGTNDNIDTYTITYSDGSTSYFTVTNGVNGEQGIQGIPGKDGHTPIITIGENGNWFIDGIDSNQRVQGLSAYELYCKYHPEYNKSEEEWLKDLIAGHFNKVKIIFDADGGSAIESQEVDFGSYITVKEPLKAGFTFDTWYLNGSPIDINTYVFFADSTLVAHYIPNTFDITLNADGGTLDYNTVTITYGEQYILPTPTKEYMSFSKWSLGDVTIPNSGVWTYSKTAVQLKAVYNTTKIYALLEVDPIYGSIDTTRVVLTTGETFILPVPTPIEGGLSFQGWYLGDQRITDAQGNSLSICLYTETISLTAKFFIEINSVYQVIAMGSAESTTGNFVLTQDLDFSGLEMSPIKNFSGVFDGNGFTLKNVTVNRGDGFFANINSSSTIQNLTFENLNVIEGDGGMIGTVEKIKGEIFILNISNIRFLNSFNQNNNLKSTFGLLIGNIINHSTYFISGSCPESAKFDINISDILITNSGAAFNDGSSFILGCLDPVSVRYTGTTGTTVTTYRYPMNISINNCSLKSNIPTNRAIYGIFSDIHSQGGSTVTGDLSYTNISISKLINDIDGLTATIGPQSSHNIFTVSVKNSINNGNSTILWGNVTTLENCLNTGIGSYWGAETTKHCIDVGSEVGTYTFDNISNSIILFPNADGSYVYYTADGYEGSINNITLLTKELFVSLLTFDTNIWNFDAFEAGSSGYPILKFFSSQNEYTSITCGLRGQVNLR